MIAALGFELLRAWVLLPALAAALLLALAGLWGLARRRAERARLVDAAQLARFLPRHSANRARARVVLAAAAAVLLALSLAGPVRGYTERFAPRKSLDIVVCMDTSRSMLARDLRPDRMTRAVREVTGLLDRLEGDRVAIVAFSGGSREIAPLTHDRTTLKALLERVGPEDNRRGGTNLGAAIERALGLFDGRAGAHEAIVLLTDGEDLTGRARAAAAEAAERGVRIYVVGIGSSEGGKIPVNEGDGESFLLDQEGNEVVSKLAEGDLIELARSTGGEYLSCETSPTPLEDLYDARIRHLDRRIVQGGRVRVPHDRYQWPLVLALACMLTEVGLRERRPRRRGRDGAAESVPGRADRNREVAA